jgi:hypothetical protein
MLTHDKREEYIQKLVERDLDISDDEMLADIFENGCIGYANMSDDELLDFYKEYIEGINFNRKGIICKLRNLLKV